MRNLQQSVVTKSLEMITKIIQKSLNLIHISNKYAIELNNYPDKLKCNNIHKKDTKEPLWSPGHNTEQYSTTL